jgi:hypothetical protein
MKYHHVSIS